MGNGAAWANGSSHIRGVLKGAEQPEDEEGSITSSLGPAPVEVIGSHQNGQGIAGGPVGSPRSGPREPLSW